MELFRADERAAILHVVYALEVRLALAVARQQQAEDAVQCHRRKRHQAGELGCECAQVLSQGRPDAAVRKTRSAKAGYYKDG